MKRFLTILLVVVISTASVLAQVPQGISDQTTAFSSDGSPVVDSSDRERVSTPDNFVTGTVVHSEILPTAIAQGQIAIELSNAATVTFLTNGTGNNTLGMNQLMGAAFTLHLENTNAGNVSGLSNSSIIKNGMMLVVYTSSNVYGFTRSSDGNPSWYSQSMSGTPVGAIATDSSIVVYTSSNAYGFARSSGGTPSWYSQSLSGAHIGAIGNGKDGIVVYTSSNAYGFMRSSGGTPSWHSQSLYGTPLGGAAAGNLIVVYTSSNSYGFARSSGGTPSWYSQSLTGDPVGIVPKQ